jgi:hypothetical protein
VKPTVKKICSWNGGETAFLSHGQCDVIGDEERLNYRELEKTESEGY